MASEDSIHPIAPLSTAVHPFPESKNRGVVLIRQARLRQQVDDLAPQREVLRLLADERKPLEERNDAFPVIREAVDLPVPAAVAGDPHRPAAHRLAKEIERRPILLRDVEGGREPKASMAAAALATDDHEAPLSQREPGQEATERDRYGLDGWPFLLIACTRHVFTEPSSSDGTSSAGYSGVPAYSQLLQLPRSTDSYGRRLPGLSFGASGRSPNTST